MGIPCLDEGSTPSISTFGTRFVLIFWTRSLMDKIKDSGSLAQGSIPCGFTGLFSSI